MPAMVTNTKSVTSVTGFGRSCGLRSQSLKRAPARIQPGTTARHINVAATAGACGGAVSCGAECGIRGPFPRVMVAPMREQSSPNPGRPRQRNSVVPDPAHAPSVRRWWAVLHDQLDAAHWRSVAAASGARGLAAPGIVLVESGEWLSRRPYHRQRVALILLNQRSFAAELREAGIEVVEVRTDGPVSDALAGAARDRGTLMVQEPAEREMRAELAPLAARG
ncbi:MAG: cryptochrome/photolyase family protein, partial [Planctomycetes bacterium]|nr:cryptochrome/photolyase family protein [Planctomycetota bacterium]